MTFNLKINKILKDPKMDIREVMKKRMSKPVKFMGEDIKIHKLSVAEVLKVQEMAKDLTTNPDESKGFAVLRMVFRASVENAQDITDEEFDTMPMDELSKLSNEIMKFSGLGEDQKGK
jgi:hypothetical protein